MKNKDDLLKTMEAHGACYEATLYVLTHDSDSALEIGLTCDRLDWLIWLLVYEGVDLTDFVVGCWERRAVAVAYAAAYDAAYAAYAAANDTARYADYAAKSADRYVADYAVYAAEATVAAYATLAASYAAAAAAAADAYAVSYAADATYERKIQLEQLHALWTEWYKS